MKQRKNSNTTASTSLAMPKELLPKVEARAKELNRNRSNYVVSLILADLKKEKAA
jgi:hypothetical protein